MTGKVMTGKSFIGVLAYCLNDKRELSDEKKLFMSIQDGLQHLNRSEVLAYNQCYGNKTELAGQLNAVSKLSRRVEQPVFHFTLSLAPGEKLTSEQWIIAGEKLAREFDLSDHQYLTILHKDTTQQHVHIIANRVGYDGKAAPTSHSKRKIADLCRELEKDFHLQEVLSPRKFLSKELRHLPRHDNRKEKMKADIKQALQFAKTYEAFVGLLKKSGYNIIKGRGITFIDDKNVKVKGSDIGYSLATIEKLLRRKQEKHLLEQQKISKVKQVLQKDFLDNNPTGKQTHEADTSKEFVPTMKVDGRHQGSDAELDSPLSVLDMLLSPSPSGGTYVPPLDPKKKKKKKKPRL